MRPSFYVTGSLTVTLPPPMTSSRSVVTPESTVVTYRLLIAAATSKLRTALSTGADTLFTRRSNGWFACSQSSIPAALAVIGVKSTATMDSPADSTRSLPSHRSTPVACSEAMRCTVVRAATPWLPPSRTRSIWVISTVMDMRLLLRAVDRDHLDHAGHDGQQGIALARLRDRLQRASHPEPGALRDPWAGGREDGDERGFARINQEHHAPGRPIRRAAEARHTAHEDTLVIMAALAHRSPLPAQGDARGQQLQLLHDHQMRAAGEARKGQAAADGEPGPQGHAVQDLRQRGVEVQAHEEHVVRIRADFQLAHDPVRRALRHGVQPAGQFHMVQVVVWPRGRHLRP